MAISKENDRHLPFDQAILPLEFGLNDSPLKLWNNKCMVYLERIIIL